MIYATMAMAAAGAIMASAQASAPARREPAVPPVIGLPPAPPPPVARPIEPLDKLESPADSARIQRALQEIVTLDVEVSGNGERLWTGALRVSGNQGGEYTSSLAQARPACDGENAVRAYNPERSQLMVGINRRGWDGNIDGFSVRVNWVRPRDACNAGGGQATVGFDQGFVLRPGASTRIAGDGGLAITLSRRN